MAAAFNSNVIALTYEPQEWGMITTGTLTTAGGKTVTHQWKVVDHGKDKTGDGYEKNKQEMDDGIDTLINKAKGGKKKLREKSEIT